MTDFKIRPRFTFQTQMPIDALKTKIFNAIENGHPHIVGKVVQHHVFLKMVPEEVHFWSPELTLNCEEIDGKVLVKGLIGPNSGVWVVFIFMYALIAILFFFGLMYGYTQWTLDIYPWAFYLMGAALLLLLIVFLAGKAGQRIGKYQTDQLVTFIKEVLEI